MPHPQTNEQQLAWKAGYDLGIETFVYQPTDAQCAVIEAREMELERQYGFSLKGWIYNGFEAAWDHLNAERERSA